MTQVEKIKRLEEILKDMFKGSDLNPIEFLQEKELIEAVEEFETSESFDGLRIFLEESRGFIIDNDIIYYSEAMKYLREHDPSLQTSIGMLIDMGYESLEDINSELLASVLYQSNLRDDFEQLMNDVVDAYELEFGKSFNVK
jgi:chitinase